MLYHTRQSPKTGNQDRAVISVPPADIRHANIDTQTGMGALCLFFSQTHTHHLSLSHFLALFILLLCTYPANTHIDTHKHTRAHTYTHTLLFNVYLQRVDLQPRSPWWHDGELGWKYSASFITRLHGPMCESCSVCIRCMCVSLPYEVINRSRAGRKYILTLCVCMGERGYVKDSNKI